MSTFAPTQNGPLSSGRTVPPPAPPDGERLQPEWSSSGSPSSPKVTWQMAPRLGGQEVIDHLVGVGQGMVHGAVQAASGLWQLVSSPVETLKPLATRPAETLHKAADAAQRQAGEAVQAARQGDFAPAGRQIGEPAGAAAAGVVLGAVAGKAARQTREAITAVRGTPPLERPVQTPAAGAREIEVRHATDSPLDASEVVLRQPVKPLTEAEAQAEALRLERQDRGHSWERHGPQLTPADHRRRVTTGVAADGVFSPTKTSTQFHSANDWVATREKALKFAEARYGLETGKRPDTARGQPRAYQVILQYKRPIDSGMSGQGPKRQVMAPNGRPGKMYSDTQSINGVTRTKTVIQWDEAQRRWVVAQHMPWSEGWDNVKKTYAQSATVHATGVALSEE